MFSVDFLLRFRREKILDPFFRREAPEQTFRPLFLGAERRKKFRCIFFLVFFYVFTIFTVLGNYPFIVLFFFVVLVKEIFFFHSPALPSFLHAFRHSSLPNRGAVAAKGAVVRRRGRAQFRTMV